MSVTPKARKLLLTFGVWIPSTLAAAYFAFWACTPEAAMTTTGISGALAAGGAAMTTTGVLGQREADKKAYLELNSDALQQELSLGAGPTIDDLAAYARVAPRDVQRFGTQLRRKRERLVGLLRSERLSDDDVTTFFAEVEHAAARL